MDADVSLHHIPVYIQNRLATDYPPILVTSHVYNLTQSFSLKWRPIKRPEISPHTAAMPRFRAVRRQPNGLRSDIQLRHLTLLTYHLPVDLHPLLITNDDFRVMASHTLGHVKICGKILHVDNQDVYDYTWDNFDYEPDIASLKRLVQPLGYDLRREVTPVEDETRLDNTPDVKPQTSDTKHQTPTSSDKGSFDMDELWRRLNGKRSR